MQRPLRLPVEAPADRDRTQRPSSDPATLGSDLWSPPGARGGSEPSNAGPSFSDPLRIDEAAGPISPAAVELVLRLVRRAAAQHAEATRSASAALQDQSRLLLVARSAEFFALHEALGTTLLHELSAAHSAAARHVVFAALRSRHAFESLESDKRATMRTLLDEERAKTKALAAELEEQRATNGRMQERVARLERARTDAVRSLHEELTARDDTIERLQHGQLRLLRRLGLPESSSAAAGDDRSGLHHTHGAGASRSAHLEGSSSGNDASDYAHHRQSAVPAARRSLSVGGGGGDGGGRDGGVASPVTLPRHGGAYDDDRDEQHRDNAVHGGWMRSTSTASARMSRAVASLPPELLRLLHHELSQGDGGVRQKSRSPPLTVDAPPPPPRQNFR